MRDFDDDEQNSRTQIRRARLKASLAERNVLLVVLGFLGAILMLQASIILEIRAIPAQCELPSVRGLI